MSLSAVGGTRWFCGDDLMEAERRLFQDDSSPNSPLMVWSSRAPRSSVGQGRVVWESAFDQQTRTESSRWPLTVFLCNLAQDHEETVTASSVTHFTQWLLSDAKFCYEDK